MKAHIYNRIAGCNRTELAKFCGKSVACISRIVTGDRAPGLETARMIADALGMEVGDVFEYSVYMREQLANGTAVARKVKREVKR